MTMPSTFPYAAPINPLLPAIQGNSPERYGIQTESGLWYSRQWHPKERGEYCRTVLNREPRSHEV